MKPNILKNHSQYSCEISCLNRAIGQLEGVRKMIEEERYCIDLLTQLKAVRSAVRRIELNILETHMQNCLKSASESGDPEKLNQKIAELRDLISKF